MLHIRSLDDLLIDRSYLTVGAFDGIHLGHQALIRRMRAAAHAAGCQAVVLTFYPHPAVVIRGGQPAFYIASPDERADLLAALGVDVVITHPFNTEVSRVRAADFIDRLIQRLGMRSLWVGDGFALGHKREGNVPFLRRLGLERGFSVEVIQPIQVDGEVVSSTRVREALRQGDVARAARFLGRPFSIPGTVVEGAHRGKTIGIPTANLEIWEERAYPARGVYACRAEVRGQRLKAVTNIGLRPTFENQAARPTIEAHLIDFEGDLYGQTIRLEFVDRLRDEMKFPGVEALLEQIRADIERARELMRGG